MILSDLGFVVETAENGQQAVDKVSHSGPGYYSIVLMDVQMPVMDGYEATKEIRALDNPAFRSLPIVALTANAFKEDEQHALEAGMNAHIAKPFDVEKIVTVINEQLARQ